MKKIKSLILLYLVFISTGFAQNVVDDVSLRGLTSNRESYYFGEPVSFAFELKNNSANAKKYWKMMTGVNILYRLFNLKLNKEVANSIHDWQSFSGIRENFRNEPKEEYLFQPNEAYFFVVDLAADLSGETFQKYTEGLRYGNSLSENLVTLPPGDYKLVIEFYLMPSEQKIEVQHEFSIQPLPPSERDAYQNFLESTVYSANSYFYGDNNYLPGVEQSYETFISNYPESIFSEYAFFNLIDVVYHYGGTETISQDQRRQLTEEFILNNNFKHKNLKVKKAYIFPRILKRAGKTDKYKALDQQLIHLKEEDPILSDHVIYQSEKRYKVKGLKNRARE